MKDYPLIEASLKTHYGLEPILLTLLAGGADMQAVTYKAETENGGSYFVKLKRGHRHDISVALLALMHAAGIEPIIPPLKTVQGTLSHPIGDFTLTVYPFVEGENGFCCTLTDEQWITLGKTLKQLHNYDVPSSIKAQIRKESYSNKWRTIVRSLYPYIDGNLTGDETAIKLQACMRKHNAVIHHLVDRAEALSQTIQKESPKFVLCHSDLHGGNVLIDKNGSLFIVDWDDPLMAPKERDLMFIGGGVANVWNRPREAELFYKGYGKTEINPTLLAYYRHERIVEDIADYGQALLLNPKENDNKAEMLKQFQDMFEPNGVVDIALNTDSFL